MAVRAGRSSCRVLWRGYVHVRDVGRGMTVSWHGPWTVVRGCIMAVSWLCRAMLMLVACVLARWCSLDDLVGAMGMDCGRLYMACSGLLWLCSCVVAVACRCLLVKFSLVDFQ